jgi:hypothetical protein
MIKIRRNKIELLTCFVVLRLLRYHYSLGGLATFRLVHWNAHLHRGFELRSIAIQIRHGDSLGVVLLCLLVPLSTYAVLMFNILN